MRACCTLRCLVYLIIPLSTILIFYQLVQVISIAIQNIGMPSIEEQNFILSKFPLPNSSHYNVPAIKMVHFMYKTYSIPLVYVKYLQSWRSVYPEYTLYFWTDSDLSRLARRIGESGGSATPLSKLLAWLPHRLMRSDLARLLVLHSFGGWYADLDVMCLRRADDLAGNHSLIVPLEPTAHAVVVYRRPWVANNAVLYSAPGHPFLAYALHRIAGRLEAGGPARAAWALPVHATGPGALTDLLGSFVAANRGRCGGRLGPDTGAAATPRAADPWCPSVRPESEFSPLFDSGAWMRDQLRALCSQAGEGGRRPASPALPEQCRRQQLENFANTNPGPGAYAYHAFLHRSELDRDSGVTGGNGSRNGGARGSKEHRVDIRVMSELRLLCATRLLGGERNDAADGC